jgi:DNA-binding transcriptional LysR family regulator
MTASSIRSVHEENGPGALALPRALSQAIIAFMQRIPKVSEKPSWDDVRLFLALCRSSTLGEAAATLGVDVSTVSRRLDALEEALAAPLFDRGRNGIALTQAAENLMPTAEEIEHVMARFASEAEGLERTVSGLVRLACPPDLAEVLIASLVQELRASHPKLFIEIDPGEGVLDLTRREADLALRTVRPVRGDLVVMSLGIVRWVLAASPAVAKALGTLRAWTDAPWVSWGEHLSGAPPARWLASHAPDAERVVRSDSLLLQLALVKLGVGVALVPEPSLSHYGLVAVKVSGALRDAGRWPSNELFLVTHRALRRVPRIQIVWDLLIARVGARLGRR